ncbi:MAG TPA: phosphotransferase [Microlunatus sp.]|nr:phosphotransferase [Microlunatus sp.]
MLQLRPDDVATFLEQRVGEPPRDLEPLVGGAWSSAWGWRNGDEELVVRFGHDRGWYETERMAVAFDGPDLPVPAVKEVGTTPTGLAYAITVRHRGRVLEDAPVAQADVVAPTLTRLLVALSQVPGPPSTPVMWHPAGTPAPSWRELILSGLADHPADRVQGWRAALNADRRYAALAAAVSNRVRTLIEACPGRRDLVHGDLLHGNVLLSTDLRRVEAVFSWKCSLPTCDFLYDAAWCSVWGPVFYPGIAAVDPLSGLLHDPSLRRDESALADAVARHHCYELQIALTHLGWNLSVWHPTHVAATAALLTELLERGPRDVPAAPIAAADDVAKQRVTSL